MKRISAFFLFAILLVNAAGFYVFYVIELQRIHQEMRAKLQILPEEKLTRLVLSSQEYKKSLVEDDEIEVKGKMFDIARIENLRDSVVVLGMYDQKEDDLLALTNEIINKPFDRDSVVTGWVLEFISLDFLPGQLVQDFSCDGDVIAHTSDYFLPLVNSALLNESPPPRSVLHA